MTRVTVFGSGSWGTAYAAVLADAGCDVTMWCRRAEVAEEISSEHTNRGYLADLVLPQTVRATHDPHEAGEGADICVLAVPSQTLRDNLGSWGDVLGAESVVVSLMKGIELGTTKRMSEVIHDAASVDPSRIVVVSGPNLAPEIAAKQPAAAVVASTGKLARAKVAEASATPYFRPYTNGDVVGTEIGGAVKNVIALAVGMAKGMGMGDNSMASLLTRGLAETARFGVRLGADPQTFLGLAGVGDMVATCASPLSRNYSFGFKLGQGMTVEEVVADTRQTAEGVKSCESILALARQVGADVPIVEAVEAVVHEGRNPKDLVGLLMTRALKHERS
ncbi:NAD(P)H-dependent glycerol-3-phosphate dehydrogenase [Luteipulveratus halotolerans]|uniref:Glycerol-3-phosphate dehydrogenase [NAD(P)+] n=1 Tax=Luteipulveratus halotolerans TaxID=1631356 RepID=A0A0L6CIR5_9MICO|nr:NAD(P)H-dependent glycerol-3-phosphate dehydrogenase [Luteipulveratus halotolerans]KNX37624.1 glycerol-3-phosphate dehydrogenase [Luteipulveratus halotolerans]